MGTASCRASLLARFHELRLTVEIERLREECREEDVTSAVTSHCDSERWGAYDSARNA